MIFPMGVETHSLFRPYVVVPYSRAKLFCPAGLANPNLQKENKVREERRMLNANHAVLRDSFATQQFNSREEIKQRNIKNAKKALATVLKTITSHNISEQESGILKPHMNRLRAEIADLDGGPSRHGNR
jgi:hypothetical protein